MADPLDYFDKVNFNTRGFKQTDHIIEYLPAKGMERKIRLCRCWQSKKFPYCDDTHKVMNEAGDSVGPFVAIIRNEDPALFNRRKLTDRIGSECALNPMYKLAFRQLKLTLAFTLLATTFYGLGKAGKIGGNSMDIGNSVTLEFHNVA